MSGPSRVFPIVKTDFPIFVPVLSSLFQMFLIFLALFAAPEIPSPRAANIAPTTGIEDSPVAAAVPPAATAALPPVPTAPAPIAPSAISLLRPVNPAVFVAVIAGTLERDIPPIPSKFPNHPKMPLPPLVPAPFPPNAFEIIFPILLMPSEKIEVRLLEELLLNNDFAPDPMASHAF